VAAARGIGFSESMPSSRKRRRRRPSRPRPQPSYWQRDGRQVLAESRPWLETMFAVDEAERRGDAIGALRLMHTRPLGPDGKPFWRPWRVHRLSQVAMLGPALPAWAVSRWVAAQAHDNAGVPGDRRRMRCEELALEVRGGLAGLSVHGEQDARCKLMDHDWVYRQLLLYELGGLDDFVRRRASPDLLAGADQIHGWANAPMTALRLIESAPRTTTWQSLATGDELALANIGSAALVVPGEHVLGRLVPIEGGVMLEATPLVVPERTARRVADDPASWMQAVAAARDDIQTGGFEHGVVDDVRQLVWHVALCDPSEPVPAPDELAGHLARRTLALARVCLDEMSTWHPDDMDPWACLRAALLDFSVVLQLPTAATGVDAEAFDRLAQLVAPPADVVCRDLARELREAA
jgi:hypothetical protein